MRTFAAIAVAVGVAVGSMGAALSQPRLNIGDPAKGRQVADRLCASCHNVSSAPQAVTTTDIKGFTAIARSDGLTAEHLAGRIIIPHPAMPDTQLMVSEIRDVIAYIMSLKPAR